MADPGSRTSRIFQTDTDESGRPLGIEERERLLRPLLPSESESAKAARSPPPGRSKMFHHKKRVRPALRHLIYSLVYNIIHIFFSIYIRLRQVYHAVVNQVLAVIYHHHRTPELIKKDMRNLSKIPQHLSVILQLPPEGGKKDRLETLVNDACEIAAWSASAGVPMLSIYERTGEHEQHNV